jgi:hypothetical protein
LEDAQPIREIRALQPTTVRATTVHVTTIQVTTLHTTKLLVSSTSVRPQLREIRLPLFAATVVGVADSAAAVVAVLAVGDLRAAAAIAATNISSIFPQPLRFA